jgi:hypothetical protein
MKPGLNNYRFLHSQKQNFLAYRLRKFLQGLNAIGLGKTGHIK